MEKSGYDCFYYMSRYEATKLVNEHKEKNNLMVVIGGKEEDFHMAVNSQTLFIVPTWIPTTEKTEHYGVLVDTPKQLYKFIKTLNNHNNWYSQLQIDNKSTCISLMDARTIAGSPTASEVQMLSNFQRLLKDGKSRNYYHILMYHFLANMTNSILFDDITLFGMMPSSDCSLNPDIFRFMEQVRYIKNKQLPRAVYKLPKEEQNLLVRYKAKPQMHGNSQVGRADIGAKNEYDSLCINPYFFDTIKRKKKDGKFNVLIFDDYMDYGNGFNAVRCLLESLGANKIIFVSMGIFRKTFKRKDYIIDGSVFAEGYSYSLKSSETLTNFEINPSAKTEIDALYDIFNS
jgi:hypothetical protein